MTRDEKRTALETMVARFDDLAIKGKKMPYVAINGNMFAFLAPDNVLAFRLSEEEREVFEAEHGLSEVRQYGSVMRGYVKVPDAIIADPVALRDLFARSVTFARTLTPKPTKK